MDIFTLFLGIAVGFVMGYGVAFTSFASKYRQLSNTRSDLANRNDPTRTIKLLETKVRLNDSGDGVYMGGIMGDAYPRIFTVNELVQEMMELREVFETDFYVQVASSDIAKGKFHVMCQYDMNLTELVIAASAIWSYASSGSLPIDSKVGPLLEMSGILTETAKNRLDVLRGTKYEAMAEEIMQQIVDTHINKMGWLIP